MPIIQLIGRESLALLDTLPLNGSPVLCTLKFSVPSFNASCGAVVWKSEPLLEPGLPVPCGF